MTVVVLTYFGTILIAMEFVRKVPDLQALTGMLTGWPVSKFFTEIGEKGWSKTYEAHKLGLLWRVPLSGVLCIVILPISAAFFVLWFIVLVLNSFHNWVNRLYLEGKRRYRPIYIVLIDFTLAAIRLSSHSKQLRLNDEKVMTHIEKQEIPVLPLLGIILLTIAFIMEITK